jgi:hypothetical protein
LENLDRVYCTFDDALEMEGFLNACEEQGITWNDEDKSSPRNYIKYDKEDEKVYPIKSGLDGSIAGYVIMLGFLTVVLRTKDGLLFEASECSLEGMCPIYSYQITDEEYNKFSFEV